MTGLNSFLKIAGLGIGLALTLQPVAASNNQPKWHGYVDLLGFPGTEGAWHRSDLFVPILQGPESLAYFNLRNEVDDDGFSAISTGLGIRHQLQGWILGAYGYIDWRETDHSGKYRQYSAGVEMLNEYWDFRFNGYFPEDEITRDTGAEVFMNFDTGDFFIDAYGERNLSGADGEVGYRLLRTDNISWDALSLGKADGLSGTTLEVWAHIGGYHYLGEDGFDEASRVNMGGGNYSVTLTDANGCQDSISFTFPEGGDIGLNAFVCNAISCGGVMDGSVCAGVNVAGAYTFTWEDGDGMPLGTGEQIDGLVRLEQDI